MRALVILVVLLLGGCAHAPAPIAEPPPIAGEIRDLRSGQVITPQQLLE